MAKSWSTLESEIIMTEPSNTAYEKTQLFLAIKNAIESGDALQHPQLHAARLKRFAELDVEQWSRITSQFPELAPYQTLTEGILATAQRLNIPLPQIDYRGPELLGTPRGVFSFIGEGRGIEIYTFPGPGHEPYYAVNLHESTGPYQENAPTLEEVTRVVSEWLSLNLSIVQLAQKHAWITAVPIEVTWRMRLE
jgi:hypothetical protein